MSEPVFKPGDLIVKRHDEGWYWTHDDEDRPILHSCPAKKGAIALVLSSESCKSVAGSLNHTRISVMIDGKFRTVTSANHHWKMSWRMTDV